MKKHSILVVILAILLTLSSVALAEEQALTLSDASVSEDETIYLTLRLNASVIGDSLGVTYTFDSEILEPIVSSCKWSQKGSISNFNKEHAGVWATGTAKDLAGDICVLAFRVKEGVKLTETSVSCTLVIKNGSVAQGSYTAQAKITYSCSHDYGEWETGNESGHTRACIHCGSSVMQPHNWDSGKTAENPEDPEHDWLEFTCQTCGYVHREAIPKKENTPDPVRPTEPVTEPAVTETIPPMPTKPPETNPPPETFPTYDPETAPTAPKNPGNTNEKEPTKQPDPTLPPQETLPHPPADDGSQESGKPDQPTEQKDMSDSNSGKNDPSNEKDDASGSAPEGTKPPAKPEATGPQKPQSSETEPAAPPTYPDNSSNYVPETKPTQPPTEPVVNTQPTMPYKDYNSAPTQPTMPLVIPVTTQPDSQNTEAPDIHDHDHTHDHPGETAGQGNPVVNGLMISAVLAASIGSAMLYLKKKRK